MTLNLGREEDMQDFLKWLEENKAHFTTYSINEIADIAEAVGFDRLMVLQHLKSAKFHTVK